MVFAPPFAPPPRPPRGAPRPRAPPRPPPRPPLLSPRPPYPPVSYSCSHRICANVKAKLYDSRSQILSLTGCITDLFHHLLRILLFLHDHRLVQHRIHHVLRGLHHHGLLLVCMPSLRYVVRKQLSAE